MKKQKSNTPPIQKLDGLVDAAIQMAIKELPQKVERAINEAVWSMLGDKVVDAFAAIRAEFIYEVCRLEAIASKRPIVPEAWWCRDFFFRKQFIETVDRLCAPDAPPTTAEREHASWMRAYFAMGWQYGPKRDVAAKTHPYLVPFNELTPLERDKDEVFLAVCEFAKKYLHDNARRQAERKEDD